MAHINAIYVTLTGTLLSQISLRAAAYRPSNNIVYNSVLLSCCYVCKQMAVRKMFKRVSQRVDLARQIIPELLHNSHPILK